MRGFPGGARPSVAPRRRFAGAVALVGIALTALVAAAGLPAALVSANVGAASSLTQTGSTGTTGDRVASSAQRRHPSLAVAVTMARDLVSEGRPRLRVSVALVWPTLGPNVPAQRLSDDEHGPQSFRLVTVVTALAGTASITRYCRNGRPSRSSTRALTVAGRKVHRGVTSGHRSPRLWVSVPLV